MKIIDITIRQFLGLESLELHLQAPINVIIGENEAGKSSIRDAIQWCLTGQARGLKTQQEQAALIRDRGKAAEVSLTFADGRTGTRRKTPKSPSTFSGPENLGPAIWPGILCDPFTFLDWPEAQRRELLFQVIPGLNPTGEEIAKRLFVLCDEADSVPLRKITLDLGEIAATKGFK
ncbi:MAG: ATP-binding protein, partial [Proteobacteria bacterium]|nr:ATP-binding protein [Pseudomonadota bacterium]